MNIQTSTQDTGLSGYSLSPDSVRNESSDISSFTPSVNKFKWFSSDKNLKKHDKYGKTEATTDFQDVKYNKKHDNYHLSTHDQNFISSMSANDKKNQVSDFLYAKSPMYDYKEGVLFQTNYNWPDKKTFKDENDYIVQQNFERDGFQESHGKMERETGDKRGTISRETWSKIGKDKSIREENLKFQHYGPISNLPTALPPESKDKILSTLYGDERAGKLLEEQDLVYNNRSIFPRNIEDVLKNEKRYDGYSQESDKDKVTTTKENIVEQSYCDEYISQSGTKPYIVQQIPTETLYRETSDNGITEKYYRKNIEDENITYFGHPSLAASTINSFTENTYAFDKEKERLNNKISLTDSNDHMISIHGGNNKYHRQNNTKEISEGTFKEKIYKKNKMIEEEVFLPNGSCYSSTVVPLKKNASVQYEMKPSYRVVFEKLTRKERITEREALDKENAATQTYVPFLPRPSPPIIKEISMSTPSLVDEIQIQTPTPPPPIIIVEKSEENYKELSKSLGNIVLSIRDLSDKLDKKLEEPPPIILPPMIPEKAKIPIYIDSDKDTVFRPKVEEEQKIDRYYIETDRPIAKVIDTPIVKSQRKNMKTRKIKKVRMEETENILQQYPDYQINRSNFYFGDGSEAALETGKGSLSKATHLQNGDIAKDVSEAYYVKASVNGGPSNYKQYMAYEQKASRKFELPNIELPNESDKKMIDQNYGGNIYKKLDSPDGKLITHTHMMKEKAENTPDSKANIIESEDEPEVVEFYKKTQTHKHKKIVIKSDAGGTEKIITENIYDPPIIITKSSRSSDGNDNIRIEKEFSHEKSNYRGDSSLYNNRQAEWANEKYNSNFGPQNESFVSTNLSSKKNEQILDDDSGIVNSSPPYPPSVGNFSPSLRRDYNVSRTPENITLIPNRFRDSYQYREGGSNTNVDKEGKYWHFNESNKQYPYPIAPKYRDNWHGGYRPTNYDKAWEDLSERQSQVDDSESLRNFSPNIDNNYRTNKLGPNRLDIEKMSKEEFKYKNPYQYSYDQVKENGFNSNSSPERGPFNETNHYRSDFQPNFYVPTIPAVRNDNRNTQIIDRDGNLTLDQRPDGNFEKWKYVYKDDKNGEIIEEQGKKTFNKISANSRKEMDKEFKVINTPEKKKIDFSTKFFPKNNYENKYRIQA
ncbi:unnamed protein product [Gordionus sp. m RMFG-2023]|uniref:uncharacterized protein LOC135923131 n=1 Tax=Gordionus sp. m RMFG-2023 TaxID=3053472 RepID=UPI0030DEE4CB